MRPSPRLATAYHEAGHAVAASAAGFTVIDCRVHDDGRGLVRYDTPGDRTPLERYWLLTVAVAGMVAERRIFGCSLPAASDERTAEELLRTFPRGERGELRAEAVQRAEGALRDRRRLLRIIAGRVHVTGVWVPA